MQDYEYVCAKCGKKLDVAKQADSGNSTRYKITLEPCETCVDKAFDLGYCNGYRDIASDDDEGVEECW